MRKIAIVLIMSILFTTWAFAQNKKVAVYSVAFYNLENLFDTINDPNTNDEEFLPDGNYRWASLKYNNKLKNMAHAISKLATDKFCPNGPAVIGVSEIEIVKYLKTLSKPVSSPIATMVSFTLTAPTVEVSMSDCYTTATNLKWTLLSAHDFSSSALLILSLATNSL